MDRHAVADHLGLEHEMFDEPKPTAGDVVEGRFQFEDREIGEEAECAEVDAEYGHLLIAHPAGRSQDRAVAAEHEHKIGHRAVVRMEPAHAPVARQGKTGGDAMARRLQSRPQAAGLRHDRRHFAGARDHQIELPRRGMLGTQPGKHTHGSARRGKEEFPEVSSACCAGAVRDITGATRRRQPPRGRQIVGGRPIDGRRPRYQRHQGQGRPSVRPARHAPRTGQECPIA